MYVCWCLASWIKCPNCDVVTIAFFFKQLDGCLVMVNFMPVDRDGEVLYQRPSSWP